jgi:DNA adenine methylase
VTVVSGVNAPDPERPRRSRRQLRLVREIPGPIVRWAGGKTKLLDEIVPRMPTGYRRYLEPFCGGAALFFRLRPDRAILSDNCAELVELYREVARDPQEVFAALRVLVADVPMASYYTTRAAWNSERSSWSPTRRAATLLYLNKTCYNGLYRVNSQGGFNTPIGKFGDDGKGDPSYPSLADLVAAGDALRRIEICCEDYQSVFDRALPGDFVYADPPYPPRSSTAKFASYAAGGFDEQAQRTLASGVHGLVGRGVQVMVSQADVPLVREIYDGLIFHEVSAPRSVNSQGGGRGHVPELLITGGYSP